MVWLERNLPIMLILVVCLALWDISNCAVISSASISNGDDKERQENEHILPTINWKRFTVDPDVKTPLAPFDLNKLSIKPIDWELIDELNKIRTPAPDWDRFTFEWNRFTLPPRRDFQYIHTDNTSLKLAIFLPTAFGIVIMLLCKYTICKGERNSDTSPPSAPVLHPPPRTPGVSSAQNDPWTPQNATSSRSLNSSIDVSRRNDSSNRSNDRPPGYSDVVIANLSGNVNTFPEVKPTIPETPPPQYDDKIMRY